MLLGQAWDWWSSFEHMMMLDFSQITLLEKILRPILIYGFLIIGLRLAGKRELAQLNPFDLVVLLTLSNTVQNAIIGNDNSVSGGIIGAITLLGVNALVVRFLYNHQKIDRLIEGEATVLVEDGKILLDRLQKELITLPELESAAHKQGFGSLAEVDRAVLEPGGSLSFTGMAPSPESERHQELLEKFNNVMRELTAMREKMA